MDANSVRAQSTAELLAARLRDDIAEGTIRAGEQLHQENLAAQYGYSRSPIREALRLLEAQGLITYFPNRGAVVNGMTASRAQEVFEIRRLLEPALIGHVIREIGDDDVAELRRALAALDVDVPAKAWIPLHWEFHERVYRLAGRPHMLEILTDHRLRISELPDVESFLHSACQRFLRCDRALITALARHDASAAKAATLRHLSVLEDRCLQRYSKP
ncbi:MAG: GntR family transcriptional regulator [Candidatus Eremiobacteraeota bacterium]|nr:GntR family transcriptional regulator [Candidatus Eremiobacteraeota bacterium]